MKNNKENIQYHYDVSNDFYKLFLDKNMIYSCGYFLDSNESLEKAQLNKIEIIFNKLNLNQGDTLLDIGCGWGTLIIEAAKRFKIRAVGITLSEKQFRYVQNRIKLEEVDELCRVELVDVFQFNSKFAFTKVTSIEMYEQLGIQNLGPFFNKVLQLMSPGGSFLIQAIVSGDGVGNRLDGHRFMDKYIFPGGEVPNYSQLLEEIIGSGFSLVGSENIDVHYVRTLKAWLSNLEQYEQDCLEVVSRRIYLLWRLYIAGSAVAFEEQTMSDYQILFKKS
jgi:cyclopropane-fatty-acyl-phospholipid synthase